MTKICDESSQHPNNYSGSNPNLEVRKIGMVSRDYWKIFPSGYPDFSYVLPDVLKRLDDLGCDTVLFSLYSIIRRDEFDCCQPFDGLNNIKTVILEEYQEQNNRSIRDVKRCIVYHRSASGWSGYELRQKFGKLSGTPEKLIHDFVRQEMPRRIFGNCCILLCGETNGVKYSPRDKKVHDVFGLRNAIPKNVNIVLNPVHDRMTRFEMKRKRQYLSDDNRWVISVWNKGKQNKSGQTRDGNGPAWTVFHNGEAFLDVPIIENDLGVEIGVLNVPYIFP